MKTPSHRRTLVQLSWLLAAVVLGMAPWLSATVVASSMISEWGESPARGLWLTLGVQLGFVIGSVVSATLLLSDRLRPARLAMWSSGLVAVATAALVLPGVRGTTAILLRVLVGAALAGVYPPGIKLASGWTATRRGTAIGALVGGTTLGSAVPHLLRVVVDLSAWRTLVLLAAASAALAAILFATVIQEGPYQRPSTPFDPAALGLVLRNRGVTLATLGYLGHMWELYAMWSTIGLFWGVAAVRFGSPAWFASLMAFASVAVGALGAVVAGQVADRLGRSTVTIIALAISGVCALAIGPALHGPLPLLVFISLVWGVSIVADSAQFSAAVTEFSPPDYVGTAVTIQTALGFLLTMVTIRLVPTWSEWWGWERAYLPLAIGPILGIVAMSRLHVLERARRRQPASA
ncbi:MAG: MFS transporter [Gemmatimonadaceae bacterium]